MGEWFTRRQKIVGLILLVMVIIAKVTLLVIAHDKGWFVSQRTYLVKFTQGHHLRKESPVKILNTEVGKVSSIRISHGWQEPRVEVTIKVAAEYADLVRQDSVAEAVVSTPVGSEYLNISPGSPGYPTIEEYGTIPSRERRTTTEK